MGHRAEMRTPSLLPEPLRGAAFRASDAHRSGVSRRRLRGTDLEAPFIDARVAQVASVLDLAASYAVRMAPDHVFGGLTAARLWGLPVPREWTRSEPLVVARPRGTTRGRARGTVHISFDPDALDATEHRGLPVLAPVATAVTLARALDHERLVHVLDALLTGSERYPDLELPRRPHARPEQLLAWLSKRGGLHGVPAMRAALADARPGVDSRFESITRRAIVLAGLPEPCVHPPVLVEGGVVHPDLGYPELRIAIEFEGDGHRERRRWIEDIDRYARLEAAGWIVVRITSADLGGDGGRAVRRVAAALARRAQ